MKPLALELFGISTEFTKQPVKIDFRGLAPGVYAFAGPNGAGKSTILEAMCPGAFYRTMPSYGEALAAHVPADIRNAYLQYDFELKPGSNHRVLIKIDGQTKKTEAYWFTAPALGAKFEPKAGPLLGDFDKYAAQFIPSLPELLAGPFAQQASNTAGGDFFSLPKIERKKLFIEWLGIGADAEIAKIAAERAREGSGGAQVLRARAEAARAACDARAGLLGDLAVHEKRRAEVERDLEAKAQRLTAQKLERQAAASVDSEWRESVAGLNAQRSALLLELARASSELSELKPGPLVEPVSQAEYDAQAEYVACIEGEIEAIAGESRVGSASATEIREALYKATTHARLCEGELERSRGAAKSLAGVDLTLEVCGKCPLTADARKVIDDEAEARLGAARSEVRGIEVELVKVAAANAELSRRNSAAYEQSIMAMEALEALAERRRVADDQAEREALRAKFAQRVAELGAELEAIVIPEAPIPAEHIEAMDRELTTLTSDHAALQSEATGLHGRISALRAKLEMLPAVDAVELAAIEAQAAELERKVDGWALLERTYGPLGIPGIKIEQAGPGVSAAGNRLLQDCYGPRFKLRLVTTQPKKAGGFKDSFDCEILDSETGGQPHRGSPGQMVILSEALRGAICVEVVRSSGKACRTLWRDEVAGSLDQWGDDGSAMRYLDMLRAIRTEGEFEFVFFIAHQPALWQSADGVFRVEKGTVTLDS